MGDITKNFSRREFVCPHCGGLVLVPALPELLQQIRDYASRIYGRTIRIVVSSGYRCYPYNRSEKIGSNDTSQHPRGKAADIWSPDLSARDLHKIILQGYAEKRFANLGGVGYYPKKHFVHVDTHKEPHGLRKWTG